MSDRLSRICDDNPFFGKAGALPDIWSLDNRNPLGAAIDPHPSR